MNGMLFDVNDPAISKHLRNIFESGELKEDSVVSKMEITASDGKRYQTQFYSLDAIIAVGYRVNALTSIWASCLLKASKIPVISTYHHGRRPHPGPSGVPFKSQRRKDGVMYRVMPRG